jgi:hypothetical protein
MDRSVFSNRVAEEVAGGGPFATVTGTPAEVMVLPAVSRARAVRVWEPSVTVVVFQVTEYGAVVSVPISVVVSTKKSTAATPAVSEAVALTGVGPETGAPLAGSVTATVGPVVSMVTLSAPDGAEGFPAASVAVAVMLWAPLLSALVVMLYAPPVAGPLPTSPPSLKIRTVLPASAVPVKVGVGSLVTLSVLELPVSEAAARSGVEGGGGGVVSEGLNVTVLSELVEAVLGLPAPSLAPPAGIVALTVPLLVMPLTATV